MKNQKLAMLGLGGRATMFYLRQINEFYQKINNSDAVCPLILKKTNFEKINSLLPDQFFQLETIVGEQLDAINMAEKVILPNITLHEAVDRLNSRVGVDYPIIHPVQSVIDRLQNDGCDQIMLFGSKYSMSSGYLRRYFQKNDIQVIVPSDREQQIIDGFRKKIYSFKETQRDIKDYLDLLSVLKKQFKTVIACTELSLILPSVDNDVYDMARVQIDEAMRLYSV